MEKRGVSKYHPLVLFTMLLVGMLCFGAKVSFAEEETSEITTDYVLFDELSSEEQETIIKGNPDIAITHDEETFRLVYKVISEESTDQTESTSDTEESTSNSSSEQISSESSSEQSSMIQSTLTEGSQENVLIPTESSSSQSGSTKIKQYPKTGEHGTSKSAIGFGVVLLVASGCLLVWKRKDAKKILVLAVIIGGTGFSAVAQAAPLELPAAKTETMVKGSTFKPETSVNGYEYIGYIHSSKDEEEPTKPEEKEGKVTVHFVNESSEKLRDDVVLVGPVGTEYSAPFESIPDMALKEIVGEMTGLFTEQDIEVTFVYKKLTGYMKIDFSDVTQHTGRTFYVYTPDGKFSPVVAESFLLYDTGYPLPSNGILILSGDVGSPVITPNGLDLSVQSYSLGVVYTDGNGEKQTVSIPYTTAFTSNAGAKEYTQELQVQTYYMLVPN